MNESKAKVEELQRQLGYTNTQRARAQAESGIQTNYLLNKFILNTETYMRWFETSNILTNCKNLSIIFS